MHIQAQAQAHTGAGAGTYRRRQVQAHTGAGWHIYTGAGAYRRRHIQTDRRCRHIQAHVQALTGADLRCRDIQAQDQAHTGPFAATYRHSPLTTTPRCSQIQPGARPPLIVSFSLAVNREMSKTM